jgi:hypothetical protein
MLHIETSIEIAAPPARVWEILTDFAAYPSWNPFVRAIDGDRRPGAKLKVTVQPAGGQPMSFTPRLLVFEEGRELRWKGQLLLPGIFDGEHYLQLAERSPGRTFVTHGELFNGLLVSFVMHGSIRAGTEQGFNDMNEALKQRAESPKQ